MGKLNNYADVISQKNEKVGQKKGKDTSVWKSTIERVQEIIIYYIFLDVYIRAWTD